MYISGSRFSKGTCTVFSKNTHLLPILPKYNTIPSIPDDVQCKQLENDINIKADSASLQHFNQEVPEA